MAEIKLIDKDTDLSKVLHPVPWDAFINGFQYQVYCVYEETKDDTIYYNHSIGGHWGENHYWAIPRGESLHWSHFIEFNGDACLSQKDVDILGITNEIILEGNADQRKTCSCPSNKKQLFHGEKPKPCEHKCLYCYWKDV